MRAILPVDALRTNQPDVGLVDQRRRLERVPGPLTAHIPPGQAAQFRVHQRDEPIQSGAIAGAPSLSNAVTGGGRMGRHRYA